MKKTITLSRSYRYAVCLTLIVFKQYDVVTSAKAQQAEYTLADRKEVIDVRIVATELSDGVSVPFRLVNSPSVSVTVDNVVNVRSFGNCAS